MKSLSIATYKAGHTLFSVYLIVITCLFLFILPSCSEKDEYLPDEINLKTSIVDEESYFGPETFVIVSSRIPVVEGRTILNPDFKFYESFVLKVKNGYNNKTKVSMMEIKIDGQLIISTRDFRGKGNFIAKPIPGLTAESVLEVYIQGNRGSYIEISIEGFHIEGSVTDIDGNEYKTVKIGDQWWMAENLKTSKYNDGSPILKVTDQNEWNNLRYTVDGRTYVTGGYCWYNNDSASYNDVYGKLYNWATVNTGKLCPVGWHVPTFYSYDDSTDTDVHILREYIGLIEGTGGFYDYGKLKEAGIEHWQSPNFGATNITGFTGLPGGVRTDQGFQGITIFGDWWSSDYRLATFAAGITIGGQYYDTNMGVPIKTPRDVTNGLSVRCIKDNF